MTFEAKQLLQQKKEKKNRGRGDEMISEYHMDCSALFNLAIKQ